MALEFNLGGGIPQRVEMVTVDRHLYLTEDKDRVVEEGDPAGRWLWAAPGSEVPRVDAERLGAIKPEVESAPAPVEPKQRLPRANKQRAAAENKAGN